MTLPTTMTVIVLDGHGGPDVLKPAERPVPRPGPGEVLIAVRAAGVNRPDVLQRKGVYPPPPGAPDWPGLEVAGEIAVVGEGVEDWREGDAAVALIAGGGYAEYALAPAGSVLPLPRGLDFVHGAAIPETFFTVWSNVFQRGRLAAGETFLVHGGTSGIGTTAIQLAHAFGAHVATTVGSPDKAEAARRLGADLAIDYRREDFVERLKDWQDGRGVDLTLDMVGGDYAARNLKVAAPDGRIVQIATLRGAKAEIPLDLVMTKRLVLTGSTLRARDVAFKAGVAAALREHVWPLIEAGRVRPLVDTTYKLGDAAEAHRHMDVDHIGKIVLDLSS
ncbi:NAD(P)H-quinone oxidoreductase [Aureimonas pseudogalii]|uniref:NADPH2:quinone reductase n=1 Tax=Aureimonas pseudogalii TaxID=1744844 RepID=A0A7W6EFV0_9HYPH|nr:NAD(P)H-quinone oxidoreductase [Aureimonas pseudogalii]MBB3997453.1 NADPH2:quinone reductase [Aureimonas pseudogalii]